MQRRRQSLQVNTVTMHAGLHRVGGHPPQSCINYVPVWVWVSEYNAPFPPCALCQIRLKCGVCSDALGSARHCDLTGLGLYAGVGIPGEVSIFLSSYVIGTRGSAYLSSGQPCHLATSPRLSRGSMGGKEGNEALAVPEAFAFDSETWNVWDDVVW